MYSVFNAFSNITYQLCYLSMPDCTYLIKTLFVSMLMVFPISIQKANKSDNKLAFNSHVWINLTYRHDSKVSSSCSSELPGVLHHDNKVHVAVNRSTDSAIIVDKLLFGYLGTKRNEMNEQFSSITMRLKSENRGLIRKQMISANRNSGVTEEP